MGRGTLWAATAGPEVGLEALEMIISDLAIINLPTPLMASAVFRHLRTLLNLTQREFGILISPEGTTPISASVICQLETGTQTLPASLIGRAAMAASVVHTFADWRREEHAGCYDSQLSALRALGPGCEAELQPYLNRKGELPVEDRMLVTEYLDIVSKRKQTGSGDRPATRGPYKKNSKKETESGEEEDKSGDPAKVAAPRGPRGPYKVKRKTRPMAVGLATGEASPSDSSSTSSTTPSSAPSSARSDSSSSLLVMSPDLSISAKAFGSLRSPTSAALNFCLGGSADLGFLERLEKAEARDQEALDSARGNDPQRHPTTAAASPPGRSPRDSPRGDIKRRATRVGKTLPKAAPLPDDRQGGRLDQDLEIVDLDKLNLADFTLDELMASPREETPLQSVDEIDEMMNLVCKEMESPRWSDFDYDPSVLADCRALSDCQC
jgi:hypothetical protein